MAKVLGFFGGIPETSYVVGGNNFSTPDSATYLFNGIDIGPRGSKKVVIGYSAWQSSATIPTITITAGATNFSVTKYHVGSGFGVGQHTIAYGEVDTLGDETSINVGISSTVTQQGVLIQAWSLYHLESTTAVSGAASSNGSTSFTISSIPEKGIVLVQSCPLILGNYGYHADFGSPSISETLGANTEGEPIVGRSHSNQFETEQTNLVLRGVGTGTRFDSYRIYR